MLSKFRSFVRDIKSTASILLDPQEKNIEKEWMIDLQFLHETVQVNVPFLYYTIEPKCLGLPYLRRKVQFEIHESSIDGDEILAYYPCEVVYLLEDDGSTKGEHILSFKGIHTIDSYMVPAVSAIPPSSYSKLCPTESAIRVINVILQDEDIYESITEENFLHNFSFHNILIHKIAFSDTNPLVISKTKKFDEIYNDPTFIHVLTPDECLLESILICDGTSTHYTIPLQCYNHSCIDLEYDVVKFVYDNYTCVITNTLEIVKDIHFLSSNIRTYKHDVYILEVSDSVKTLMESVRTENPKITTFIQHTKEHDQIFLNTYIYDFLIIVIEEITSQICYPNMWCKEVAVGIKVLYTDADVKKNNSPTIWKKPTISRIKNPILTMFDRLSLEEETKDVFLTNVEEEKGNTIMVNRKTPLRDSKNTTDTDDFMPQPDILNIQGLIENLQEYTNVTDSSIYCYYTKKNITEKTKVLKLQMTIVLKAKRFETLLNGMHTV